LSSEREPKKHTDFTKEQIEEFLCDLKSLVNNGAFTISKNEKRQENVEFMEDYNISTAKAKEMLQSLEVLDFCFAVDNIKEEFVHERLYVFCKCFYLENRGNGENIDVYIKSNLTNTRGGKNFLIVISFHKRNKPISYCFK
jgi:hypothetical protein